MKNDLDLKKIIRNSQAFIKKNAKHSAFIAVLLVLLIYIMQVWQISKLSVAEPSAEDNTIAQNNVPHIDQKAIDQIQSLEQSNTQVHALFNSARNNPFQ